MARQYGQITTAIWAPGSDFRKLTAGVQRLYLFLFSQQEINPAGVIAYTPARWAAAARGLTRQQVLADLAELAEGRYVLVDEDTDELLVRSFMRNAQVYTNPKWWRTIPDFASQVMSTRLRQAINAEIARCNSLLNGQAPPGMLPLEGLPDPVPDGVPDGVTDPYRNGVSPARTRGRAGVNLEPRTLNLDKDTRSPDGSLPAGFLAFYDAYPRHTGRGAALRAWHKAIKAGVSPETIEAGARSLAADPNLPPATFIPHPSTWLNREGWADDPLPPRSGAADDDANWRPYT